MSVLGYASAQIDVATHRVISLDPARQRRRRQSASHPDDATLDLCDLDGGPDNAPERGFGQSRPWRASRRRHRASLPSRHVKAMCSNFTCAQLTYESGIYSIVSFLFHAPPHKHGETTPLTPPGPAQQLQLLSAWTHCRCIITSLWRNGGVEAQSPKGPPTRHHAKE